MISDSEQQWFREQFQSGVLCECPKPPFDGLAASQHGMRFYMVSASNVAALRLSGVAGKKNVHVLFTQSIPLLLR
jgi:hypothetical protein